MEALHPFDVYMTLVLYGLEPIDIYEVNEDGATV